MKFDIIIVGAGPAGLSMGLSLAKTNLKIAIVDQQSIENIENPSYDGREIALTHESKKHLSELNIWSAFENSELHKLTAAKVFTGLQSNALNFDSLPQTVSELGYIVSNHVIRKKLFEEVKLQKNIQILCKKTISTFSSNQNAALLTTVDGEIMESKLVIAADSRFSTLRGQMGIPVNFNDFARTAIVFKVRHQESHNNTAMEFFNYGHTLAILPLQSNESSIVITIDSDKANDFNSLSDEEIIQFTEKTCISFIGKITDIENRFSYPLVGALAKRFVNNRCAVIGDAAVGMHPVTAHGYNLGLQSAVILAEEICKAQKQGKDIASRDALQRYQQRHMRTSKIMYKGTNLVVKLFTNDAEPVKIARKIVLDVSNKLTPLKHLITRKLTHSN